MDCDNANVFCIARLRSFFSLLSAVSLAEHHLLVMWSTIFYLLERYADEISDQEFKANILKVLFIYWCVFAFFSVTKTVKPTSSVRLHACWSSHWCILKHKSALKALSNLLLFWRSRCRHRRSCISFLMTEDRLDKLKLSLRDMFHYQILWCTI